MVVLEHMLDGRLEPGLHHAWGPAGTRLVEVCMAFAASVAARGRAVAWIDTTNGFSPARLSSVAGWRSTTDVTSLVLLCRASNPLALETAIDAVSSRWMEWNLGAVVLDRPFGCLSLSHADPVMRRVLRAQAGELLSRLALAGVLAGIPVVIANGVSTNPRTGEDRPTGDAIVRGLGAEPASVEPLDPGARDDGRPRFRWVSNDDEAIFSIDGGRFTFHPLPGRPPRGMEA